MERCRMYGKHKEAEDARSSTERMVKFLQCHLSSAFVSDTSAPTSPLFSSQQSLLFLYLFLT